jgi:anti-anti-sigma regulatory factor
MVKANKKPARIRLSKISAEIISSRDIADILRDAIKKTDTESIVLDFTDIKFISRSAAHSLILLKEKFETLNRKYMSFENADNDVSEMLRIVSANKIYPKKEKLESGDTPREALILLFEALQGYVESAKKIKARPHTLNQKPDLEYEKMWQLSRENARKSSDNNIYTTGSFNIANKDLALV